MICRACLYVCVGQCFVVFVFQPHAHMSPASVCFRGGGGGDGDDVGGGGDAGGGVDDCACGGVCKGWL